MGEPRSGASVGLRVVAGVATALALVFAALLLFQLVEGRSSASRAIGVVISAQEGRVLLEDVSASGPANLAGLRAGDLILHINEMPVHTPIEYDEAAQAFDSSTAQIFAIERQGEEIEIAVFPGVPFDWLAWAFNALAAIVHLGLGLLVMVQGGRDLRARLLWILFVAIGLELAMPMQVIGAPGLSLVTESIFWLLTGIQFSVELHLASLIPQKQAWLRSRRWPLTLFYLLGIGFGLMMFAASLPGASDYVATAWVYTAAGDYLTSAWFLAWPLGVVLLLGNSALRWPEPTGRQQAWLVLFGVLPWAALTVATTYWDHAGLIYPTWVDSVQPLIFLIYPLVVFVAIFRYRLFDLELVVRRSLVYGALSTILVVGFYAVLGLGGALMSRLVGGGVPTTWVVTAAALMLGLFFSPLKRAIERQIERRFFPERVALRERLTEMVRDLPLRGRMADIAETLVGDIVETFAVEGACLLLSNRDSDLLVERASTGFGDGADGLLLPKSDPLAEFLLRQGRPGLSSRWPRARTVAANLLDMGAALGVPIVQSGELTGILVLGQKIDGDEFSAEEVELLGLLGHHVAAVLENAHLFESATVDALTGQLRREAVLAELQREIDRARRYRRPLTVAMIDVDRFKAVNDEHGHLAGDLMLRRVAAVIAERVRSTDVVGRYGGEEFLVLLPEGDAISAGAVLEKLRGAVEDLEVELDDGQRIGVTVSIGMANLDGLPAVVRPTPEALIAAADRSLYRAKDDGRNRLAVNFVG